MVIGGKQGYQADHDAGDGLDGAEIVAGVVGYSGTILLGSGKPHGTIKKNIDTGKPTNCSSSAKINHVNCPPTTCASFLEESRK